MKNQKRVIVVVFLSGIFVLIMLNNLGIEVNEVLVSVILVVFSTLYGAFEGINAYKTQRRWEKQIEFYRFYLDYFVVILKTNKKNHKSKTKFDIERETYELKKQIPIFADEEFIRNYVLIMKISNLPDSIKVDDKNLLMFYVGILKIIKKIRREINHEDTCIKNSELFAIYLNDDTTYNDIVDDPSFEKNMENKLKELNLI